MSRNLHTLRIFTGTANPELAQEVARCLNRPLGRSTTRHLADSEIHVTIDELVRGDDVYIIQPCSTPVNARLMVSRDRYGKKPLFYYIDDECMCFSSTIRAIQEYTGISLSLRNEEMDSYLRHGKMFPTSGEDSHFIGIKQVLPGQVIDVDLESWSVVSADDYDPVIRENLRKTSDQKELAHLVKEAVVARLTSDRQVGLLLSGGIDSTLVLSAMCSVGMQDQVRCFIGETGKSPDARYAEQCVEKLGIEATTIKLRYDDATFDRFLNMCRHHEKAFSLSGNAMAMSEMYQHIREQDVPVVLDGTGGDEFFGGYWDRSFRPAVREALKSGDVKWLWQSATAGKQDAGRMVDALRDIALRNRMWSFDPKKSRRFRSPSYRLLGLDRYDVASCDPLESAGSDFTAAALRDIAPGGRLGEWIWHNDRNAMMSGIENRSPLLDHRLRSFIGTGYANKIHKGWNKYELRSVFSELIELPTQWRRQKQGFRWNGKNFIRQNQGRILDLISQSECLRSRYDVDAYVDRARGDEKFLCKAVTARLLCIAGLEETLGITPQG